MFSQTLTEHGGGLKFLVSSKFLIASLAQEAETSRTIVSVISLFHRRETAIYPIRLVLRAAAEK